jgi:enamine deaminase RidA (YjgF/YER057c/UK114 family)
MPLLHDDCNNATTLLNCDTPKRFLCNLNMTKAHSLMTQTLTRTLDSLLDGSWIPTPDELEAVEAVLPMPPQALGSYVPAVLTEDGKLFTSGMLPMQQGALIAQGALGDTVSLEIAQRCARLCALNLLALVKSQVGSLKNIKRVVKLVGFVSSTASFYDQPKVINGASDLLVQVLGEAGKHARSAVGVPSLPLNAPVEIELLVSL